MSEADPVPDLIKRLRDGDPKGADALFAPGLTTEEQIRTVCQSVKKPVNFIMGLKNAPFAVEQVAALGVRRISVGSALSRAALGAFVRAAKEIREHGTFSFAEDAIPFAEANQLMAER